MCNEYISTRDCHVGCEMNTFQHVQRSILSMWDVQWKHFNAVLFPCAMCNQNISTRYLHMRCAMHTFQHATSTWEARWIHFNMMDTFQHDEYRFQHNEYISTSWIHFNIMNIHFNIKNTFRHDEYISTWWIYFNMTLFLCEICNEFVESLDSISLLQGSFAKETYNVKESLRIDRRFKTSNTVLFSREMCTAHISTRHVLIIRYIGWLRLVGSLKLQVSFAEYRLFCRALLQKRPIILMSLLVEATP